jgi:hypothetical protein
MIAARQPLAGSGPAFGCSRCEGASENGIDCNAGKVVGLKGGDIVLPLKDPTSDMAIIARKGSDLVKKASAIVILWWVGGWCDEGLLLLLLFLERWERGNCLVGRVKAAPRAGWHSWFTGEVLEGFLPWIPVWGMRCLRGTSTACAQPCHSIQAAATRSLHRMNLPLLLDEPSSDFL